MRVASINNNPILFKGYYGVTTKVHSCNRADECVHESHVMRDIESLDFASNYIKKEMPEGTHIAVYGCSGGEDVYSEAALLDDVNKSKKYKLTGYDIAPNVIEDAKTGLFSVSRDDDYERFLLDDSMELSPAQIRAKEAFKRCFEPIPDSWINFNIKDSSYTKKIKEVIKPEQNIDLITKRLEYLHRPFDLKVSRLSKDGIKYIPKNGRFNGIIDFKVADIMNIDKELAQKKTGVVIFKNSLYHLLNSRGENVDYDHINIKPAEELFKKIHSILPEKGLFGLGTLEHDHFRDNYLEDLYLSNVQQEGKQIKAFVTSRIHFALKEAGFEPIFYETEKLSVSENAYGKFINSKYYLPSVWKKVSKSL